MSEYPRIEFRCSRDFEEFVFDLTSRRDFQELEITKSVLIKKAALIGMQIIMANPRIADHIKEEDFLKGDK
jgi:hypothetical protein